MAVYALRRLLTLFPVLLGLITVVFALLHVLPGDPARMIAGSTADPAVLASIRHEMGFDRPLAIQYLDYLWHLAQGDLGRSYQSRRPVLQDLADAFPKTVMLAIVAETMSSLLGVGLGVVAAVRRDGWVYRLVLALAALSLSFPLFWLALMLQLLLALAIPILPPSGYKHGVDSYILLPALTLALPSAGFLARMVRSALVDVFDEEYLRTARAKGLRERTVVRRHAVPNALVPIATTIGLDFARLLAGILIVEVIFTWPGIGKYAFDALAFKDLPALQGSVIVLAMSVTLVNLAVDILYGVIDPRIRYR